jgi:hypothetical protein
MRSEIPHDRMNGREYVLGVTQEEFNAIVAERISETLPDDPLEAEFQKLEREVAAREARKSRPPDNWGRWNCMCDACLAEDLAPGPIARGMTTAQYQEYLGTLHPWPPSRTLAP